MTQAFHITHEAAVKIGGIGAVLAGMCTADIYINKFSKTVFFGPLFDDNPSSKNRLGDNAKILYSTPDNVKDSMYNDFFDTLSAKFNIDIVYGEKTLFDEIHPEKKNKVDILLLGIKQMHSDLIDVFKFQLWEVFNFSCKEYESDWDFEQYLRIALPVRMISDHLFSKDEEIHYFSHEYMGVASCLSILLNKRNNEKIYFHAHEISTARAIVEKLPGHDVSFYHLIDEDMKNNISMEERFGSQKHNSRNELIKLADKFDNILAVGDWVKKEYNYLKNSKENEKVKICYNAIPVPKYVYKNKSDARNKLIEYCENLYNFKPDVIFSHVTRLVVSKGLWRDIALLEELDKYFSKHKLKGFLIILSTLIGSAKPKNEILKMEKDYGWPVMHKESYPDLIGYENDIYWSCQYFNAKSKSIKAVFLNQFGFSQERAGNRVPKDTNFADLRLGSDAELGMSVYEPFGIAQIETIPFGGVAIVSRACGSAFLLEKTFTEETIKPYFIVDFAKDIESKHDWTKLTNEERVNIEKDIIAQDALEIFNTIPKTEQERKLIFEICQKNSDKLSWNEAIKNWDLF